MLCVDSKLIPKILSSPKRKLETKRATPKHLVGKAEANIATNKAFIGPPEQRGRGHSGLSEDISDEDLKG